MSFSILCTVFWISQHKINRIRFTESRCSLVSLCCVDDVISNDAQAVTFKMFLNRIAFECVTT